MTRRSTATRRPSGRRWTTWQTSGAHSVDLAVADAATKALLGAVHPLIDDPFVGDELAKILSALTGDGLRQLRVDIEHLSRLHQGTRRMRQDR